MKYRKKPVVIEAMQFDGTIRCLADINAEMGSNATFRPSDGPDFGFAVISTLEGEMVASPQDFIIRGVKGEFYPCKPDIFAATYEPAEAPDAAE
jgi:hypothetical protein